MRTIINWLLGGRTWPRHERYPGFFQDASGVIRNSR